MRKIKLGWPKSRRSKLLSALVGILVIAGVIILIVKHMSAPAVGSISQAPPAKAELKDPYAEAGHYSGRYVSFTYPRHYKKIPSKLSGNYLEVVEFYATDHSSRHIAVGIQSGSIGSDSGVSYRRQHPELYHEQPQTRFGVSFSSSATGSEQTAYTQHGGFTATVSVTAPSTVDLAQDANTVLTSLQWK